MSTAPKLHDTMIRALKSVIAGLHLVVDACEKDKDSEQVLQNQAPYKGFLKTGNSKTRKQSA